MVQERLGRQESSVQSITGGGSFRISIMAQSELRFRGEHMILSRRGDLLRGEGADQ